MGDIVKRGLTTGLVSYFIDRPSKVITIDHLRKDFPDWDRGQILQAVTNLLNPKPGRNSIAGLEKLQTGVWRYVEPTGSSNFEKAMDDKYMQFEILKTTPTGDHVAMDDEGTIYKITKIG